MYVVLILLSFVGTNSFGQNSRNICYSDEMRDAFIEQTPQSQSRLDAMNRRVKKYIDANEGAIDASRDSEANLLIPVVVYVVHENGPENISDTQVFSQINALNNYFTNHGVQFCLASMDGTTPLPGSPTPGIIRVNDPVLTHNNGEVDHAALAATSTLSNARFLRIWVVNDINGGTANGYSIIPELLDDPSLDGIVMAHDAFGDIASCMCTTLNGGSEDGKILVHEVGHYLGLYHTFEGSCAGMNAGTCDTEGDYVCDTPPVATPNNSCATPVNSCMESPDLPDDLNNYMDYVPEDCLNNFTDGQEERMFATISLFRSQLVSSENLGYTGINCNGSLLASFSIDNYNPCINDQVTFTADPIGGATYDWEFGDGATASGQVVTHTYTSEFIPANVILTVSSGSNAVSSIEDIFVTDCASAVIDNTQGFWYFGSQNGLDFNSGVPVYNDDADLGNSFSGNVECVAVQSDAGGQFLFGTNGVQIWDQNHITLATNIGGDSSSATGAIIVPTPGQTDQYIIFTTRNNGDLLRTDITTVGGQASIIASNVPIPAPPGYLSGDLGGLLVGEGVTAIAGCDDSYWIIVSGRKTPSDRQLVVLRLDDTGISFQSEIQLNTVNSNFASTIPIESAPNGKKIAIGSFTGGNNVAKIFDFDPINGLLDNLRIINRINIYGLSFSSNSRVLYAGQENSGNLYQYDTDAIDPNMTEAFLGVFIEGSGQKRAGMQMGPDNKIYLSRFENQLAVIHEPNNLVSPTSPNACMYSNNGPTLETRQSGSGLPNMIDANTATVFPDTISYTVTNCTDYSFEVAVCATTFNWNFGDPASGTSNTSTAMNPNHVFSGNGTYTVTLNASGTIIETIVNVGIDVPISGETTICLAENITGNYSVALSANQDVVWTITGGTIIGLNGQSNVTVDWTSIPGTVNAVITDSNTGCSSSETIDITEECDDPCPDCNTMANAITIQQTRVCGVYQVFVPLVVLDCYDAVLFQENEAPLNLNAGFNVITLPTNGSHVIDIVLTNQNTQESCTRSEKIEVSCHECPDCEALIKEIFIQRDRPCGQYQIFVPGEMAECYRLDYYIDNVLQGTLDEGVNVINFTQNGTYELDFVLVDLASGKRCAKRADTIVVDCFRCDDCEKIIDNIFVQRDRPCGQYQVFVQGDMEACYRLEYYIDSVLQGSLEEGVNIINFTENGSYVVDFVLIDLNTGDKCASRSDKIRVDCFEPCENCVGLLQQIGATITATDTCGTFEINVPQNTYDCYSVEMTQGSTVIPLPEGTTTFSYAENGSYNIGLYIYDINSGKLCYKEGFNLEVDCFCAGAGSRINDTWVFGQNEWNFNNSGTPDFVNTQVPQYTKYATASVSDSNSGNLLFYSDGITVFDSNNNVMSNGTQLLGDPSTNATLDEFYINASICQGTGVGQNTLILPKPGSASNYYLFTNINTQFNDCISGFFSGQDFVFGLRYAEIDMSANGGLGAVISKNNLITNDPSTGITATFNAAENGYWLLSASGGDLDAYGIDATGISSSPVSTTTATPIWGDINVSPDSARLLNGYNLYDFNNATGIISNPNNILSSAGTFELSYQNQSNSKRISEFSANSSIIYLAINEPTLCIDCNLFARTGIAMYNILTEELVGVEFGDYLFPFESNRTANLQRAANGKIYLTFFNQEYEFDFINTDFGWNEFVAPFTYHSFDWGVINDPNTWNATADPVTDIVAPLGVRNGYTFPQLIPEAPCNTDERRRNSDEIDSLQKHSLLRLYPNPASNFVNWSFDDTVARSFNVSIFTALGTEVYTAKNTYRMDVSQLSEGIYFVKLITADGKTYVKQFIVK